MSMKELKFNVFGIEFSRVIEEDDLSKNLNELKSAAIDEVSNALINLGFVINEYEKCC